MRIEPGPHNVTTEADGTFAFNGLEARTYSVSARKDRFFAWPTIASVQSSTEPVTFQWSATDASGIAAYAVFVQTDGGSWAQDTSISTATQVSYALQMGHSYGVAVEAKVPDAPAAACVLSSFDNERSAPPPVPSLLLRNTRWVIPVGVLQPVVGLLTLL